MQGIEAATGNWMTADGYSKDLPRKSKIEKITANPLPAKQDGISVEEAKKIAEQFLAIDSDKIKLKIESIQEMDNYNGQAVINVQYMYHYRNGGSGASLEINKNTGEVIQYYNIKDHLLLEIGEKPKNVSPHPTGSAHPSDKISKRMGPFLSAQLCNARRRTVF